MSRLVICSASAQLVDRLGTALAACGVPAHQLTVLPDPPDPGAAVPWGDQPGARTAAVLDTATTGTRAALELSARLAAQSPGMSVVLVHDAGHELALAALRVGVTDIVHPDAADTELVLVLRRALELSDGRAVQQPAPALTAPVRSGQVISVVSPKGGVGKTTVATNLAVGLARTAPQGTVLVDLDIQFGDVASGLSLDPEYFLTAAVAGPANLDTMVLKTYLTLHETGLYVLCAPESPVDADAVTADDVRVLLRTLAAEFRYVVVDTAPGLSEHTLAAMDETTDLVLLTSMDVPGLRGLRKELDTLRNLDLLAASHQVVVNFADPGAGLSVADVEATIGTKVDLMLPRSKAAPASVNLGVPLLQSGVRDPMTKKLRVLVQRLIGEEAATAPPQVRGMRVKGTTPAPRRAASGWFRRPRALAS